MSISKIILKRKLKRKLRCIYNNRRVNMYNNKLCIMPHFSNKHVFVQIINYQNKNTVASASSMEKWFKECQAQSSELKSYNMSGAILIGKKIAEIIKEKLPQESFYFERKGKLFHGKLAALCNAMRESEIKI